MEAKACEKCEGRGCGSCGGVDAYPVEVHLRTYDPRTHIVVSREAAGQSRWALNKLGLESYAGNADAEAELRAALEVGR